MKQVILTAVVLFLFSSALAAQAPQHDTSQKKVLIIAPALPENNKSNDSVFTKVDKDASFPGGNSGWSSFLVKKLAGFNPADNGAPKGRYQVIVRFIVSKEGRISDLEAETNLGFGMEKIVLQLMTESPLWEPAILNGKKVHSYSRQPVSFVID